MSRSRYYVLVFLDVSICMFLLAVLVCLVYICFCFGVCGLDLVDFFWVMIMIEVLPRSLLRF